MRYITITTPDNIEIEYRLAGAGSRAAAAATDFLIQILLYAALAVPAVFIFLGGPDSLRDLGKLGWGAGALLAVLFIILFGYYIVSELLLNGRTPGKKIFGLRAIRENGMPVSFLHSLIRNIFKLTVDIFGVGFFLALLTKNNGGSGISSRRPSSWRSRPLFRSKSRASNMKRPARRRDASALRARRPAC